jgi:hypothetical protein
MLIRSVAAVAALLSGGLYADDFVTTVASAHPIAYFRLDSPSGKSDAGASNYQAAGGVTSAQPGPPVGIANNHFAKFNGRDGWIKSTQSGGVALAASIMAWVNLESLPSQERHFFYVAGESESGNDLDIQFETDNVLRFFTASGGSVSYAPPATSLVNQWHMLVVTMDASAQSRVIYWDGKQVAADRGGGRANKTSAFSIGASTVFGGRFFKGGIAEVALWNHALAAKDVAAIYAAAGASPGSAGAPSGTGPFAMTAKVEAGDADGPIKLKREEQVALMFLTAIEQIEWECRDRRKSACTLDQMLAGPTGSDGGHLSHLKFDPKIDPNYTYMVGAREMNWEVHATARKPGLLNFYFLYKGIVGPDVSYSNTGAAGPIDKAILNRGIDGDSFVAR